MAHSVPPRLEASSPARVRRQEIIRSAEDRKLFPQREAQRRLQQKERRWAPIGYSVFFVAVLAIAGIAYTTYAFSKYRGTVLPGVYIDNAQVSGLSPSQARTLIANRLVAKYNNPVTLRYNALQWQPKAAELGLQYDISGTVKDAMAIGRTGAFLSQLIDRLPLHPIHTVSLRYSIAESQLLRYIRRQIANGPQHLYAQPQNASLSMDQTGHVRVNHSQPGRSLDVAQAEQSVRSSLDSLAVQVRNLTVVRSQPRITDLDAIRVQDRVESFLRRPPVITVGRRVFVTSRYSFSKMLSFRNQVGAHRAAITMKVDPAAVTAFVQYLASQVDLKAENAKMIFDGQSVRQISPRRLGRTLDQTSAYQRLLPIITGLKPNARLRLNASVTQPPVDATNPASLGITTLLGTGSTSFAGSSASRLSDITKIAKALDQDIFTPGQVISFNTLVAGTAWADTVYHDTEVRTNGQVGPGDGGAMQQVATTLLRALYSAGLVRLERHAHPYRLRWYEPPAGYDALVSPAKGYDLRFLNSTGGHLLIEVQVQPLREQLFVYVYGPKLGWKVAVDSAPQITNIVPHGPKIIQQNPALAPGERRQLAFAHDGAHTVIQRTVTHPNGDVSIDKLVTDYQAWQAVIEVGAAPAPRPTPKPTASSSASPSPTTTAGPGATPTPTFNH